MTNEELRKHNTSNYPFLEPDDPKLEKNPFEILREEIDLDQNSMLPKERKQHLMNILEKHHKSFSLYGEIGKTNHVIDLDMTNKESKYIRPYNISLEEREMVDKEMKRLLRLGVIKEGLATFSSPVMLVNKKDSKDRKRVVLDLRQLNQRITKLNTSYPLIEDCLRDIGKNESQFLSALDITDAFFGLKLSEESQKYAGISTYSGGKSYYFQRLPQGLSLSPAVFSNYIKSVISEIPGHEDWLITYIDDLLIHSRSMEEHMHHIDQVLAVLGKHNLKIKPSKAQLFRKSLDYLGYTILIKDGKPHISAQRSKIDSIRRLKAPTNVKGVRMFCGAVNYLSRFLPRLCDLLKPMRKLTRKNAYFKWTDECERNFLKIKELITKAPVLRLPRPDYTFRLYIDTSIEATGCSIYQVPHKDSDDERLIGFYSRNMPEAARSYSVSELEAMGIMMCLKGLRVLQGRFIQIFTDHSALVHIMKSEREVPTLRLKKIVERLSDYHFEIGYRKGSEMVICDWLSRSYYEEENLDDIEPIVLSSQDETTLKEHAHVVTRSRARKPGHDSTTPPDSHDMDTEEEGPPPTDHSENDEDVIIEEPDILPYPEDEGMMTRSKTRLLTSEKPNDTSPDTSSTEHQDDIEGEDMSSDPIPDSDLTSYERRNTLIGTQISQPQNPLEVPEGTTIPIMDPPNPNGADEGTYLPPNDIELQDLGPLFNEDDPMNVVHRRIPKQFELDKFIEIVKKRSLRNFSLPLKAQQISHLQRNDPYFKDIYAYCKYGALPSNSKRAHTTKCLGEDYILVNDVLFKVIENKGSGKTKIKIVLAVPDRCLAYIFSMHHDSLWSGHLGLRKTFVAIRSKYFIPALYEKLQNWIRSCAHCQERKEPMSSEPTHDYLPRLLQTHEPFAHLHLDIKYVFPSNEGYQYLLVIVDTCTRYCLAFPLKQISTLQVAEIILQRICFQFGFCKTLSSDKGKEFDSQIMNYLSKALKIQQRFCTEGSHESILSERAIRTLSDILISKMKGRGKNWPLFVASTTFAYNCSPHTLMDGYSPFELLFGRKPRDPLDLDTDLLASPAPTTIEDYATNLKGRLAELGETVTELHNQHQLTQATERAREINRKPIFQTGDLVYLLFPKASSLNTGTFKWKTNYIGPLVISSVIDNRLVTLTDFSGKTIYGVHSIKRLKRAHFKVQHKSATNIHDIKEAIKRVDDIRKNNPDLMSIEPHSMFCMLDGSVPETTDPYSYLTALDLDNQINNRNTIELMKYCGQNGDSTSAIPRKLSEKQIVKEAKR